MWIENMFLQAKFRLPFMDLNFRYVGAAFVSRNESSSIIMSTEKEFGSSRALPQWQL